MICERIIGRGQPGVVVLEFLNASWNLIWVCYGVLELLDRLYESFNNISVVCSLVGIPHIFLDVGWLLERCSNLGNGCMNCVLSIKCHIGLLTYNAHHSSPNLKFECEICQKNFSLVKLS